MAETLTYIQLLDELEELVRQKESGTLYIQSDSRHLITVSLDNGRIFAMYHGPKRGEKALDMIRQLNGGSYRFDPMGLGGNTQDIPETREILELLRTPVLAAPSATPAASPSTKPSAVDATSSIDPLLSTKTQEVICQDLKQLLGEILGPIAGMVFDDITSETTESCSTPEHTRTLIAKLVEEIDDADEAEQFKHQADAVFERLLGQ